MVPGVTNRGRYVEDASGSRRRGGGKMPSRYLCDAEFARRSGYRDDGTCHP